MQATSMLFPACVVVLLAMFASTTDAQVAVPTCAVVATKVVLGYVPGSVLGTYVPLYQKTCSGLCLSEIDKPTTCLPTSYQYVSVLKAPYWYAAATVYRTSLNLAPDVIAVPYTTNTVRIIRSCGCTPQPCVVNGVTYQNGQTAYNACGERCTCSYGKLTGCCRLRKSFIHMSATERLRYTTAIYQLNTNTGVVAGIPGLAAQYTALIDLHGASAGIHSSTQLLSWHRWYILQLENLLRKIDCRITVPYWAWERESASPWTSPLWNVAPDYFGGGTGWSCVPNGPFVTPFALTAASGGGCLTRARSGSVPTVAQVNTMLATPYTNFASFFGQINGMHGSVHCAIGGTMCNAGIASNAPEFFLHHGNMDRLWGRWQALSVNHQTAYTAGGLTAPLTNTGGLLAQDLLYLSNQPGGICVQYVEPRLPIIILSNLIASLPLQVLQTIPTVRTDLLPSLAKWQGGMRELKEEMAQATAAIADLEAGPKLGYDEYDDYTGPTGYSAGGVRGYVYDTPKYDGKALYDALDGCDEYPESCKYP